MSQSSRSRSLSLLYVCPPCLAEETRAGGLPVGSVLWSPGRVALGVSPAQWPPLLFRYRVPRSAVVRCFVRGAWRLLAPLPASALVPPLPPPPPPSPAAALAPWAA